MSLRERIGEDVKAALKSGRASETGVLRLMIAAFNNKSIEKRSRGQSEELTNDDTLQVLNSEAKKRRESIEVFTKGGRSDLADKEKAELEIIQRYLPKQMAKEAVEKVVADILGRAGANDIGSAMKAVMAELKGRADSSLISQLVKEKLGKS